MIGFSLFLGLGPRGGTRRERRRRGRRGRVVIVSVRLGLGRTALVLRIACLAMEFDQFNN